MTMQPRKGRFPNNLIALYTTRSKRVSLREIAQHCFVTPATIRVWSSQWAKLSLKNKALLLLVGKDNGWITPEEAARLRKQNGMLILAPETSVSENLELLRRKK